MKDNNKNRFGFFNNTEYEYNPKFYGNYECFLFTFFDSDTIHVYPSTGINENYIYCQNDVLAFGCSNKNFSLVFYNDFQYGFSSFTNTFKNNSLNGNNCKFVVYEVELWSIGI